MSVLITGASTGIGKATAVKFLSEGFDVIGIDRDGSTLNDEFAAYNHIIVDINDYDNYPELDDNIDILINNAGTQNEDDIKTNLISTIKFTEKYGVHPNIRSIVNIASTSAHSGAEFPEYAASKGGLLAYTKNVAQRVAKFNATCNSISPGGVITNMNRHILDDDDLYNYVLGETLLLKWASTKEIAEWVYFVSVVNKSMTGQDIIIDNGELSKFNFVW